MEYKDVEIILKEIPYKIESCIVNSGKKMYISFYKDLSMESKKRLIDKGVHMIENDIKFFIE